MRLKPLLTEKSLNEAKNGKFTFLVERNLNKHQIANLIEKTFEVNVITIATMNSKKLLKKNFKGKVQVSMPVKKAIVGLKDGQKISFFEESKKETKSK